MSELAFPVTVPFGRVTLLDGYLKPTNIFFQSPAIKYLTIGKWNYHTILNAMTDIVLKVHKNMGDALNLMPTKWFAHLDDTQL